MNKLLAVFNGACLILFATILLSHAFLDTAKEVGPVIKDYAPLFSLLGVICVAIASYLIAIRLELAKYDYKLNELRFSKYQEKRMEAFEKIDGSLDKLADETLRAVYFLRDRGCIDRISKRNDSDFFRCMHKTVMKVHDRAENTIKYINAKRLFIRPSQYQKVHNICMDSEVIVTKVKEYLEVMRLGADVDTDDFVAESERTMTANHDLHTLLTNEMYQYLSVKNDIDV